MVARTATVTGILTRPGTTQPWQQKKITFACNTPAFTVDGTTEKHNVGYVTTGLDGSWSKTFEINDDLDPAATWYTYQVGTTRWAFQLLAAHAGLTVTLRSVLVSAPGNTQPVQAGITTAIIGAANGVAALDSGGRVPRAQLPNVSGAMDYAVANQAAMLALTADPDTQLRVQRTDTPGVQWVLNPGLAPATLSNWLSEPFDPSGAAGAVLSSSAQKSANLSDLANAATARTNLGLGSAATQPASAFDAAGAAAAVTTTSIGAATTGALATTNSNVATNTTNIATNTTAIAALTSRVPAGGTSTTYLRGDGTWATPAGSASFSDGTLT